QEALYSRWDIKRSYYDQPDGTALVTPVKSYFCPSRRSPPSLSRPGLDRAGGTDRPGSAGDYAASAGTRDGYGGEVDGWDEPNLTPANGAMICADSTVAGGRITTWKSRTTMTMIKDGASNTFLIGERHVPVDTLNADIGDGSVYNGDHHRVVGRCASDAVAETVGGARHLFDLAKGPTDMNGGPNPYQRIFGSSPTGVVNFVFCDGSVRTLTTGIPPAVLPPLAHRPHSPPRPSLG